MLMMPFRVLWREARWGKSIGRILANQVLAQWKDEMYGVVLDLACGQMPSYRRFLGLTTNPRVRLVGIDYSHAYRPTVVADLKTPLPFKDGVADVVIVSSFLYIVAEPRALLYEVKRVLKQNAILLLTAPLVYPFSPEPTDYWRFTEEALRLLLDQTGFADTSVLPIGGRWSTATYLVTPFLRPRWLVTPLAYWLCLKLDAWTEKRFQLSKCPIGYVVKASVCA